MPLKLVKRKDAKAWYIHGTVRRIPVRESTGTTDRVAAEAIRITREAELLNQSIHGKRATVTFADATLSYLEGGGSPKYIGQYRDDRWDRLLGRFYDTKLSTIGQNELDAAARILLPDSS